MKVKMFGPLAGTGPDGMIRSWGPNEIVQVDDDDAATVAYYQSRIDAGVGELVDESGPIVLAPPEEQPVKTGTVKGSKTPPPPAGGSA
jgi:ABC-type amino acid transport substrate-binding protein